MTVAALYVDPDGVYAGLDGVEVWDEQRDARLYAGPWPVVAHPPCARWSIMGACRGYRDGDDSGCFAAALEAVRRFGGVLEHPRYSLAWERFSLPAPTFGGWTASLDDPGWTTEIDQHAYGLRFRKPTWLYYVGPEPPPMFWRRAGRSHERASNGRDRLSIHNHHGWGNGQRSSTPPAFRDALIEMARGGVRFAAAASYVAEAEGRVKIGWTSDPERRWSKLERIIGEDVYVWACVEGTIPAAIRDTR